MTQRRPGAGLGRRGFLQASAVTAGGLLLPRGWSWAAPAPAFPEVERLGRVHPRPRGHQSAP